MTDEMRPEYVLDYSKGVRGKYFWRLIKEEDRSVVVLDPDVAKAYPNSDAVNKALRGLMKGEKISNRPKRSRKA